MKLTMNLQQLEEMLELFNELYKQADSELTKKSIEIAIEKTKAEMNNVRLEMLND